MSDEKEPNLTHGYEIKSKHQHALDFMVSHMNEHQVKEMVERANDGHAADFRVIHEGKHLGDFQLTHHNGRYEVHQVPH